jgi:hypothetical protein
MGPSLACATRGLLPRDQSLLALRARFSVLKVGAEDGALRHKDLFYHPVADNYFKL